MSEAFDSEAAKKMARAMSLAMERLGPSWGLNGDTEDEVRSALARAIIESAENGERDAEKLAVYAVDQYKKTRGGGSPNN